jgi:DNA-directed RNA polymerase I, II, and III subunit RPABC2
MSNVPDLDDRTSDIDETTDEDVNSLKNIITGAGEGSGEIGSDSGGDSDIESTEELETSTSKDQPENDQSEFMKENILSGKSEAAGGKGSDSAHKTAPIADQLESDESEEEEDNYLKKLEVELHRDILLKYHPEIKQQNYNEVLALCKLSRDTTGSIVDPLHRTLPFLSKYERARVLGLRAKQLNTGSDAFVEIPEGVIDGLIIARLELAQGKIPFIIRRPLPNGQSEYWKLTDLEDIYY